VPVDDGVADCRRSRIASVDGPASSGMASGTTEGSPSRKEPVRPPSAGKIIRNAMRNSTIPPAMLSLWYRRYLLAY
jgi:hypothetical protein